MSHVRRVILEIRGEDPKAVESLEQHFSEALSDRIARMGGEPQSDGDGDFTGVVDLWGCTVEEVS